MSVEPCLTPTAAHAGHGGPCKGAFCWGALGTWGCGAERGTCVVWRGVVWCGVVWCAVVWCGVVCCSAVWCAKGAVTKRQWPGWSCTRQNASREGRVSKCVRCVVCFAPMAKGPPCLKRRVVVVHGCPWDPCPSARRCYRSSRRLCASGPWSGGFQVGSWAAENLQYTATLRRATGSGGPAVHRHAATLLGGSGQRNYFYALLHSLGAVGSGSPSLHCHIAGEQWAVRLLHGIATLLGSGRQWDSFSALPH